MLSAKFLAVQGLTFKDAVVPFEFFKSFPTTLVLTPDTRALIGAAAGTGDALLATLAEHGIWQVGTWDEALQEEGLSEQGIIDFGFGTHPNGECERRLYVKNPQLSEAFPDKLVKVGHIPL